MAKKRNRRRYATEDDYKNKLLGFMRDCADEDSYRRSRISENFDYYFGKNIPTPYDDLLTLNEVDGDEGSTPFYKINFDSISPKINVLLGEFISMGFEVNIEAYNKDAIKRKQIYKKRLEFLQRNQALMQQLSSISGIDYGVNENLPQNEEELSVYMDRYRDVYELLINTAINQKMKAYNYKDLRRTCFLDMLMGGAHVKVEVVNGESRYRRVNPLQFSYDIYGKGDYLDDRSFCIEAHYIPISEAIDRYGITGNEMHTMIEDLDRGTTDGWMGKNTMKGGMVFSPFISEGGFWEGTNYGKILVIEGEWLDVDIVTSKVTTSNHGRVHSHVYLGKDEKGRDRLTRKERMDERNSLEVKGMEVYRKCTLVGTDYVADYGELEHHMRDYEDPSRAAGSYVSVIPAYNQHDAVSIVDRVRTLQDFRNYVWTMLQLEVTTSMPDLIEVNRSAIDEETYGLGDKAIKKLVNMAKGYRVIISNEDQRKWNKNGNKPAIGNISMQKSGRIIELTNLAHVLDDQISQITGINENRMGIVGDRMSGKANQQVLNSSTMVTKLYYSSFEGFEGRIFERHAKQIAILWADNPDRYETYAAQLGIELPEDIEIDLQSYKAYVTRLPLSLDQLQQAALGSVDQGNLKMHEYLELMLLASRNIHAAIRKFIKDSKEKEAYENDLREREMNANRQAMLESDEKSWERRKQELEIINQGKIEVAEINQDGVKSASYMQSQSKDRATQAARAASIRKEATK